MPEPANVSPIEEAKEVYLQLAALAEELNAASDQLGKIANIWDAALKKLNLGVSAWVTVTTNDAPEPFYDLHQLGYDRIEGKWCVALRHLWGREDQELEGESEIWAFSDSPRWLRIAAIDKMPSLLNELMSNARQTGARMKDKLSSAKSVALSIRELLEKQSPKSQ